MAICLFLLTGCKSSDYKKAYELCNTGNYDEAKNIYESLADYKDSKELAVECSYLKAQKLLADGDYNSAEDLFISLADYKDSKEYVKECDYQKVLQKINDNDFKSAKEDLINLGDYKDSKELIMKCDYVEAKELFDKQNWLDSLEIFKSLGNYEDSESYAQKCDSKISGYTVEDFMNRLITSYNSGNTLIGDVESNFIISALDSNEEIHFEYKKDDEISLTGIADKNKNIKEVSITSEGKLADITYEKYITLKTLIAIDFDSDTAFTLMSVPNSERIDLLGSSMVVMAISPFIECLLYNDENEPHTLVGICSKIICDLYNADQGFNGWDCTFSERGGATTITVVYREKGYTTYSDDDVNTSEDFRTIVSDYLDLDL